MLRNLAYYISFIALIIIFGATGISGLLDNSLIYVISGTVIFLSFGAAIWLTLKFREQKKVSFFVKGSEEAEDK